MLSAKLGIENGVRHCCLKSSYAHKTLTSGEQDLHNALRDQLLNIKKRWKLIKTVAMSYVFVSTKTLEKI
jgi:hypothetical protein